MAMTTRLIAQGTAAIGIKTTLNSVASMTPAVSMQIDNAAFVNMPVRLTRQTMDAWILTRMVCSMHSKVAATGMTSSQRIVVFTILTTSRPKICAVPVVEVRESLWWKSIRKVKD